MLKRVGKNNSNILLITAAEIKVSLSVFYFILIGSMALVAFTVHEVQEGDIRRSISEYILCTSQGNCFLSLPENILKLGHITDVSLVMLSLFPLIIFILSINLKTCKMLLKLSGILWIKQLLWKRQAMNVILGLDASYYLASMTPIRLQIHNRV